MAVRICFFCGQEFHKPPSVKSKYCSWECFQKGLFRGDNRKGTCLICSICEKPFYAPPARIMTAKYCCYRCHQIGEGRKGGVIRAAQKKAESLGLSYPKINGRHAHRVIMEEKVGRSLTSQEVVHHKNGNRLDFDVGNLDLKKNQGDHIREHIHEMLAKRKVKHGY